MTARRAAAALVVAVTLGVVGTACSDSGDGSGMRDTTTTAASGRGASSYVGLTKAKAIAKAEADGRPWRIGREDDEQFALSQDFVPDRVTFEIDDGRVTTARLG